MLLKQHIYTSQMYTFIFWFHYVCVRVCVCVYIYIEREMHLCVYIFPLMKISGLVGNFNLGTNLVEREVCITSEK